MHAPGHRFQTMSDEDLKYESFFRHLYLAPPSKRLPFSVDYAGPEDEIQEMIIKSWSDPLLHQKASRGQIGRALWFILYEVNWTVEMYQAAKILFRETIERLASDALGHIGEPGDDFDSTLFMFWDSTGWYSDKSRPPDPERVGAFVDICRFCLNSEKASMQESALHGLGHNATYSKTMREEIEQYLRRNRPARKELIAYAKNARRGMIQ